MFPVETLCRTCRAFAESQIAQGLKPTGCLLELAIQQPGLFKPKDILSIALSRDCQNKIIAQPTGENVRSPN